MAEEDVHRRRLVLWKANPSGSWTVPMADDMEFGQVVEWKRGSQDASGQRASVDVIEVVVLRRARVETRVVVEEVELQGRADVCGVASPRDDGTWCDEPVGHDGNHVGGDGVTRHQWPQGGV